MSVLPPPLTRGPSRATLCCVWGLTFAAFITLYSFTCQRGISWQDSGTHQHRIITRQYRSEFGLAVAHPGYIAAGRLMQGVPIGDLATRVNLLSSLGMALALANLAVVASLLTGRPWIALATAGMLGTAHMIWWLATIAESYALVAAGFTAELWLLLLLVRKPSWQYVTLLGLVSGIGWSVHNFALLPLPIYLSVAGYLLWQRQLPRWSLATALLAYLVGSLPLTLLIVEHWQTHGSLVASLKNALFGDFQQDVLNVQVPNQRIKNTLALASLNFSNLLLPGFLVGLLQLWRRLGGLQAAILWAILLIELLFFVRYPVPDQVLFIVPSLFMLAVVASIGLSTLADRSPGWRQAVLVGSLLSITFSPLFYAGLPGILRYAQWAPQRSRPLAYRDETRYWVVPWKHNEDSAQRFAEEALAAVPKSAMILAGDTSAAALRAAQSALNCQCGVHVIKKASLARLSAGERSQWFKDLQATPLYIVAPAHFNVPPEFIDRLRLTSAGVLERAELEQNSLNEF